MNYPQAANPIESDGAIVDMSTEKHAVAMLNIGRRRTQRLALSMISDKLTLPDALSAAYIQGFIDYSIMQKNTSLRSTK